MNIKDKYKEYYKIPFPSDLSDNEKLADIRIEMLLYDDFVAGAVGKYISGKEVDAPCLRYDGSIENLLTAFISDENNTIYDKNVANLYLNYVKEIKALLGCIP